MTGRNSANSTWNNALTIQCPEGSVQADSVSVDGVYDEARLAVLVSIMTVDGSFVLRGY